MSTEILQTLVTLVSVYVFLDTFLFLVMVLLSTVLGVIGTLLKRKPLSVGQVSMGMKAQVQQTTRRWVVRVLLVVVFLFPVTCVYPVFQLSERLHDHDSFFFHRLARGCLVLLAIMLAISAWFHDSSLLAWLTGMFWVWVIDGEVDYDDEDDDHGEDGGGNEPDSPTPHGDAAERWLHSQQKLMSVRHTEADFYPMDRWGKMRR